MNILKEDNQSTISIWLDCDPGHDDAFAIILAGWNKKLKLLGISTVLGNQTVEKTTLNALKILSVSGLENIEVVSGQHKPLLRPSITCPEIHGNSGLDCSVEFPPIYKKSINKKAIIYMNEVISSHPKPVTIIATGCLTNIALLLTVYPEIKEKIEQLVFLGGAIGVGNMSPAAEFNMLIDPEAAKIVFESGLKKIVMIPIEVSHNALVTPQIIQRLHILNKSNFSKLIIELLHFFADTYKKVFKFEYPPLHDPLAVAYVINPSLFETVFMRVDIETSSELCSGRTVCDIYHLSNKIKNIYVAQKVDIEGFWDLMIEALFQANSFSPLNKKQ